MLAITHRSPQTAGAIRTTHGAGQGHWHHGAHDGACVEVVDASAMARRVPSRRCAVYARDQATVDAGLAPRPCAMLHAECSMPSRLGQCT